MKEFDFGKLLASILQLLKKIRRIFFFKDFSQEFLDTVNTSSAPNGCLSYI